MRLADIVALENRCTALEFRLETLLNYLAQLVDKLNDGGLQGYSCCGGVGEHDDLCPNGP